MLDKIDIEGARKLARKLHLRYLYCSHGIQHDSKRNRWLRATDGPAMQRRLSRISRLANRLSLASMTEEDKKFLRGCLGFSIVTKLSRIPNNEKNTERLAREIAQQ
jgi:hypothetical protein